MCQFGVEDLSVSWWTVNEKETEAHHSRAGPRPRSGSAPEVRGPRHSALCPDGPHGHG